LLFFLLYLLNCWFILLWCFLYN